MAMHVRSVAAALIALFTLAPVPARAALPSFFNGFETDLRGWDVDAFGEPAFMTRVPSKTDGIASRTGGFHAESNQSKLDCDNTPPFIQCGGETAATNWGGYSGVPGCSSTRCAAGAFPQGGYTTALDIYLDVSGAYDDDTRFDYASAISAPSGEFRRQFVFNAGFYGDDGSAAGGGLGAGPRFVISASYDAGRSRSSPVKPANDPFVITASGWYTFRHRFYDSGAGHVLAVELSILDASGAPLHRWTLSDPSDVIDSTVGGNRYGWLASQEFPFLAIDNSSRCASSGGAFDFCGDQYQRNFRDVRRGADINAGGDVAGGGHPSLNITGSSGAAGDTWVTVYDPTPDSPDPTILTGTVHMSMDVLFGPFNNRKSLGLLALYNEGGTPPCPLKSAPKGLALFVVDNGNTDALMLATVRHDPCGTPSANALNTLVNKPLGAQVQLTTWYRLTLDVVVMGGEVSATGKLFSHVDPADPNSAISVDSETGQPKTMGTVSRRLSPQELKSLGLSGSGEIGIVGASVNAVIDSSVTNFTATQ